MLEIHAAEGYPFPFGKSSRLLYHGAPGVGGCKEMIQTSVRQQSDMAAAMAVRLNRTTVDRLWMQQTAWRKARPDDWWADVPDEWDQK
ncbi:MAG TPA: hypothetical protein VJ692_12620 [Nitrospiraceae bacterium]|nr:hypothetical protein [Nitrospiraceae bacterium]